MTFDLHGQKLILVPGKRQTAYEMDCGWCIPFGSFTVDGRPLCNNVKVDILSGYIQMFGVLLTVYVLFVRARIAELTSP
jgi:hypothetical protein